CLVMTMMLSDPDVEQSEVAHCELARRINRTAARGCRPLRPVRAIHLTEAFRVRTSTLVTGGVTSGTVKVPHDRRGHTCLSPRARMADCEHVWDHETDNRERCSKCGGAKWWRSAAKVNGGSIVPPSYAVKPPQPTVPDTSESVV